MMKLIVGMTTCLLFLSCASRVEYKYIDKNSAHWHQVAMKYAAATEDYKRLSQEYRQLLTDCLAEKGVGGMAWHQYVAADSSRH